MGIKKKPLAVATISFIRNKEEERVVFKTIRILSLLGIPVIIADGGSLPKQKKFIRSLPNITLLEEKGLTQQLKASFRKGAAIADSLFYLQTDKLDFVERHASNFIAHYLNSNSKGMLIPVRSEASFNSYPNYQRKTEEFLNFIISSYCGKTTDYYYGPKIFSTQLVKYLTQLNKDIKWGIEAYFYAINYRLSLPMDFYNVNIKAPKEILFDEFEFKKYRLELVQWQTEGLIQGHTVKL